MRSPRIALTSTEERFASLAAIVERQRIEPVSLPCIRFAPADCVVLDSARRLAQQCDWLVVTSARAIDALWPGGGMPVVSVAAVGPSTAAAVEAAGGTTRIVGGSGSYELFRMLSPLAEGKTVFFPHAAAADLSNLQSIEATAGRLDTMEVYEVRPVSPGSDPVDAVVFGSPTAVDGWFRSRGVTGLTVGAIGPITAEALAGRRVGTTLVPDRPSFERLIGLIAEDLRDRSAV